MSDFDKDIHPASHNPADHRPPGPERQFDLLVDGELNEGDRHALLLQLEHEPDGWRRCALAFLEAQCWKAELGQMARIAAPGLARAEPVPQAGVVDSRTGQRQNWRQFLATTLAIAASFLLTLVVVRGWSGGSLHSPDSTQVRDAKDEFPLARDEASSSPAAGHAMPAAGHAMPAVGPADQWETVTLPVANPPSGQPETLSVQALPRDTLDEDMLERVPVFIPPELQRLFEQSGHRVVQQREINSVQMKDGRRLVVPVDRVQIHYVGRPSL